MDDVLIVERDVTKYDIDKLAEFSNNLFNRFGIDIEFTRHFADRVNDPRNRPEIDLEELIDFFKRMTGKSKAKRIKRAYGDSMGELEVILVDMQKNLNLPAVLELRPDGKLEIRMKTIMRKRKFHTRDPKLFFESFSEFLAKESTPE